MNQSLILLPPAELVHAIGNKNASLLAVTAKGTRDALIEQSRSIERVAGEASQQAALKALGDLDGMLKLVEAERTSRKSPYFEMGKRIDAAAKEFTLPIEAERTRLKRALSAYQMEVERQAREAKAKLEAELARLNAERAAAEATIAVAPATPEAEAASQKILEADLKAASALMAAPAINAKPENAGIRHKWVVQVVDAAALYKAFPELVNLVPKLREINSAVARMASENPNVPPSLPGCKVTKEIDVTAK